MKSNLTKRMESDLLQYLYWAKGQNAVIECKLGMSRKLGIVDVLSVESKVMRHGRGIPTTREFIFRCYEIKVSKSDFYSDARLSFHGDYNLFVLTQELWETVKDDIPDNIGVLVYTPENYKDSKKFTQVKRSKKTKRALSETQFLSDYLVSASRDSRRWVEHNKDR